MDDDRNSYPEKDAEQINAPAFVSPPPPDVDAELRTVKHAFPFSTLDPDAVKVVRRLDRFGHEAYLVGGCVRDILLGLQPKDFDVVTSARPNEVKRLFRNCRLIGRRFRLAHLLFRDRKVIEVATFRRHPTAEDDVTDRHAAENLFGGPADDAVRRDFTINSLMYDVRRKEIRDWVGGLDDIEDRLLRTIGDPDRRLVEDPVRIIRAIKFGTRLGLEVEPDLIAAVRRHAALVAECSQARLVEETFKLLRTGYAASCLRQLRDLGVLAHLMPELTRCLDELTPNSDPFGLLERADKMVSRGSAVSESVLLAATLYPACREALNEGGDAAKRLEEILRPLVAPLVFTRRHMARVRQIFIAQRRLAGGPRTKRARKLLDREFAAEAIDMFEISAETPEERQQAKAWRDAFASRHSSAAPNGGEGDVKPPGRPRRRRRRRPRRSEPPKPAGES